MAEFVPTRRLARVVALARVRPALRQRLAVWWHANRVPITEAVFLFLAIRVALSIVATVATALLPEQRGQHEVFHRSTNVWLDVWARWDSEYYLDIAQYGYALRPELAIFFPLYPLLLSTFAPLLGYDYVLSGVLVSNLAYLLALVYLFKLTAWEFDEQAASRTVLYLSVYPTALFFSAVYTESLFLAVTVAAFYYARRRKWALAGLAALLASLTRPNGAVLLFPLGYEAWRQIKDDPGWRGLRSARPLAGRLMAVGAAALGVLIWSAYLWWLTDDPFAYIHRRSEPPWLRVTSAPWATMLSTLQYLGDSGLTRFLRTLNTVDLGVAVLLIEATIVAFWRLPRIYAIYLAASIGLFLSSSVQHWPLQSLSRYSLVLFPLFFLLAQLGANRYWHRAILVVSASILGLFTALFATWYSVI
jgi:Gpi18-like mannosyltransferase